MINSPFLPQGYTVSQTAKSWVAWVGSILTVVLVVLQQSLDLVPADWLPYITAAIGVLTAVSVFYTPNALTDAQIAEATGIVTSEGRPLDRPPSRPPPRRLP